MQEPRYEDLSFSSMDVTFVELASGDAPRIIDAILAASLYSPDGTWVESAALALTSSPASDVQRAAVLAIGHIARRVGQLHRDAVEIALARLSDGDAALAGTVEDVRDDLKQFLD